MVTKIRHWLTEWRWLNHRPTVFHRRATSESIDHQEQAFLIATADNINEALPKVLERFQACLDSQFSHPYSPKLLVVLSHSDTGETFINHAPNLDLPKPIIQALHRRFTTRQATSHQTTNDQANHSKTSNSDAFELSINDQTLTLLPHQLVKKDHFSAWLLMVCEGHKPAPQKLNWYSAPIEMSLSQGIDGWFQREAKIRVALEAERSIFAAELHDSLAQMLGYLRIKSAKLNQLCQAPEYQVLKPISQDLADYTHCAYRQTRELITSSRLTLQTNSLVQGVVNSIQEFEEQSMIVFELDNRFKYNNLTPQQSTQILYIVRESLNNIVRHSHASHARVVLNQTHRFLNVVIEDNGDGIDPKAARKDSFGLQIMHERAERIGAQLRIGQRTHGGTRVDLNLEVKP
jgi:nitrate/nitrite-specific signal transduction histidine kinase